MTSLSAILDIPPPLATGHLFPEKTLDRTSWGTAAPVESTASLGRDLGGSVNELDAPEAVDPRGFDDLHGPRGDLIQRVPMPIHRNRQSLVVNVVRHPFGA